MTEVVNQLGQFRLLEMVCNPHEDYIWRVLVCPDGSVVMSYIGYCPIDTQRRLEYSSVNMLPEWAKDRMAVLNMMPPNANESVIFGVGRRIDETIWWIVEPAEERLHGTDA